MRGIRALIVASLFVAGLVVAPAGASGRSGTTGAAGRAASTTGESGLAVYTARLDAAALGVLRAEGVDFHDAASPRPTCPGCR